MTKTSQHAHFFKLPQFFIAVLPVGGASHHHSIAQVKFKYFFVPAFGDERSHLKSVEPKLGIVHAQKLTYKV